MADIENTKVLFELVTPMVLAVSEDVDMVVVPGVDGDFGVLPGHTPVLTTIRPGVINMYTESKVTKSLFVEGGFAEVNPQGCIVLAEAVIDVAEISAGDAQARLATARDELLNNINDASAKNEVKVAKAMVMAAGGNSTQH
ncbi:MAG: ATP synthase F1 subunit epsilon [Rhodospirillales bacterium]|jgi:F-type H+-transporting ATPase subunit epsilon